MTIARDWAGAIPKWDVADRLHKSLRYADVSVGDMADHLGVHRNSVSAYINGRQKPSTAVLRVWAMRCGVPFEWLRAGDSPPVTPTDGDPSLEPPVGVEPTTCRLQGSGIAMVLSLPRFRQDDLTEREAA